MTTWRGAASWPSEVLLQGGGAAGAGFAGKPSGDVYT